jgi:hypothetical protein
MSPENVGKISALARAIGSNFVVCHRWEEVWAYGEHPEIRRPVEMSMT